MKKLGKALKQVIGSVAPTLGAAVGGPFAGVAMKFLADKFTGGDTGEVEDFLLAANPETLKELKLAEKEFQSHMRELDIREEELHAGDRDSARKLAIARGMEPQVVLSVVFVVGYFGLLGMLISGVWQIPEDQAGLFGPLLGVMTAGVIKILDFWFGSSAGSKSKTAALARQASQ